MTCRTPLYVETPSPTQQLLNKNISMILPPPFPALHDGFLLRYIQRREGRYMNQTRPVFVQHSSGFIRAALLTLRESTEDQAGVAGDAKHRGRDGSNLAFMGALKPLNITSQVILVRAPPTPHPHTRFPVIFLEWVLPHTCPWPAQVDDDGMVLAISEGIPALAGISLADVRQRSVSIEDLLPGRSSSDSTEAQSSDKAQNQESATHDPRRPWQAPSFREVLHASRCNFRVNEMSGPSYRIWIMKVDRVGPAHDAGVGERAVTGSEAPAVPRRRAMSSVGMQGPRFIIKGVQPSDGGRSERAYSITSTAPVGARQPTVSEVSNTSFSEHSSTTRASDRRVLGAARRRQVEQDRQPPPSPSAQSAGKVHGRSVSKGGGWKSSGARPYFNGHSYSPLPTHRPLRACPMALTKTRRRTGGSTATMRREWTVSSTGVRARATRTRTQSSSAWRRTKQRRMAAA